MTEPMVGTLIGPHGESAGRWMRFEEYHNLTQENERLRTAIRGLVGYLEGMTPEAMTTAERVAVELLSPQLKP